MPEHRKHTSLAAEGQEVSHQGVQDAERQGVLLIEQQTQENAVGAVVFHLCQLEHRSAERHQEWGVGGYYTTTTVTQCATFQQQQQPQEVPGVPGVQHWDGALGQNAADDDGLSEGTRPGLTQRDQNT